jgi:hypothetical protein
MTCTGGRTSEGRTSEGFARVADSHVSPVGSEPFALGLLCREREPGVRPEGRVLGEGNRVVRPGAVDRRGRRHDDCAHRRASGGVEDGPEHRRAREVHDDVDVLERLLRRRRHGVELDHGRPALAKTADDAFPER